jgi:hypothetical protein
LVLVLLGLASSAALAKAKVIWNDPVPLSLDRRDGFCRSSPLDRAEHLAWHQNRSLRRLSYPFVPSTATPFGLWVPFMQTIGVGPERPLGVFGPFYEHR